MPEPLCGGRGLTAAAYPSCSSTWVARREGAPRRAAVNFAATAGKGVTSLPATGLSSATARGGASQDVIQLGFVAAKTDPCAQS